MVPPVIIVKLRCNPQSWWFLPVLKIEISQKCGFDPKSFGLLIISLSEKQKNNNNNSSISSSTKNVFFPPGPFNVRLMILKSEIRISVRSHFVQSPQINIVLSEPKGIQIYLTIPNSFCCCSRDLSCRSSHCWIGRDLQTLYPSRFIEK